MKKSIFLLLALSMLLTLCACGGSSEPAAPAAEPAPAAAPEKEAAPAAQPESEAAPAEETAQIDGILEEARIAIENEDIDRVLELLNPLVAAGDPRAKHLMGRLYVKLWNPEEGLPLLEEAAEAGVGEAYVDMGRAFENGLEGEPDYEQAEEYYAKAAEAGVMSACYRLGAMYNSQRQNGLHDFAASERWFLLGAEQEDPDCLYGLGRLYAYGDAWQENYGRDAEKAVYYLQKAGERGDALNILGELYEHGAISNDWSSAEDGSLTAETTLEADPVKALDYYRRALECESPSEIALINLVSLGKELQEGRGLEMNVELAEEAFRIAAEHGSEEAQQLLQSVA